MKHIKAIIGIIRGKEMPRNLGDQGNPYTYNFPVKYNDIGPMFERIIKKDHTLSHDLIIAAKELEKEGVNAITTTCGFMVLYQDMIANSVNIPVFTSSLMQVPFVHRMLQKRQKIGIITAREAELKGKYLKAAGISEEIPLAIAGLEDKEYFNNLIYTRVLDVEKIKNEVIEVSKQVVSDNVEIGAIVFECANLPPYAQAVQEAIGLPVFDIYTLTKMVYEAISRKSF